MRALKLLLPFVVIGALTSCSRTKVADGKADAAKPDQENAEEVAGTESDSPADPDAELETKIVQVSAEAPAPADPDSEPASSSVSPREWAQLHLAALQTGSAGWSEAIRTLQTVGDGFTIDHLKRIRTAKLSDDERDLLASCVAAIEDRLSAEDEPAAAEMVLPRLERAAYCDLTSNPLETVLVQWTLTKLRSQANLPQVRARLEQISTSYQPKAAGNAVTNASEQMFGSMSDRVPLYVNRVLDSASR